MFFFIKMGDSLVVSFCNNKDFGLIHSSLQGRGTEDLVS